MEKLANLRRELSRASEQIRMFIPRSCDIRFLFSNMPIEANNASYDVELRSQYFETQVDRHEVISKFEEGLDKS